MIQSWCSPNSMVGQQKVSGAISGTSRNCWEMLDRATSQTMNASSECTKLAQAVQQHTLQFRHSLSVPLLMFLYGNFKLQSILIVTILLCLHHSYKNISDPGSFLPIHTHTAGHQEETLPSKDASHWHDRSTKQMAYHLGKINREEPP